MDYEDASRHYETISRSFDSRLPESVDRLRVAIDRRNRALSAYLEAKRRDYYARVGDPA